jgi:hypothetical protein
LFCDWRYLPDGSDTPDFPLNYPASQGAQILLAGDNFGCGSSREHAPWALVGWGFRVVISTSFADIFKGNSLKNGLLPVVVSPEIYQQLLGAQRADPKAQITVDLRQKLLSAQSWELALARVWLLHHPEQGTPYLELKASIGASRVDPSKRWNRTDGAHHAATLLVRLHGLPLISVLTAHGRRRADRRQRLTAASVPMCTPHSGRQRALRAAPPVDFCFAPCGLASAVGA